jgi:hypothetical protein
MESELPLQQVFRACCTWRSRWPDEAFTGAGRAEMSFVLPRVAM